MPNPGAQISAPPQPGTTSTAASVNAAGQFTPVFDEQAYLAGNPDVAQAIATGQFQSGLAHYNQIGKSEGRQGSYLNQTPITDLMGNQINNPSLPQGTQVTANPIVENPNEVIGTEGNILGAAPQANVSLADQQQKTTANTYDATTTQGNVPNADAAQGTLSDGSKAQAAQGNLSAETMASLDPANVQGEVDERATVQFQYKQLTDFPAGQVPPWAAGAVREAEMRMASRGLGASTMSGEGVTAAILQAAMPIASQDAKVFETMTLANLDKKAQATFLKAGYLAQMDMKNLDNRQAANVQNAQAFLQMDMSNLNNQQQTNMVDFQARVQSLMSDASAENASKQFNATSKNQVDQFFASLAQDVEKFNAGATNDIAKFNTQLQAQREEFNAKQQLVIDQSNAVWRRQINTMNTTADNAANATNAQNLLGLSNYAMSNLWQQYRDEASWIYNSTEAQKGRDLQLALAAMGRSSIEDQMSNNDRNSFLSAAGGFASKVLTSWLFG